MALLKVLTVVSCENCHGLLLTCISSKSPKIGPSTVYSILPHLLHIYVVTYGLIYGYLWSVENGNICVFGWRNGTSLLRNSVQLIWVEIFGGNQELVAHTCKCNIICAVLSNFIHRFCF